MTLRIWMVLFVDPSLRWLTISSGLMEVNVTAKKIPIVRFVSVLSKYRTNHDVKLC